MRGRLRDAWPPSAGSTPRDVRLHVPPNERRWIETTLLPTRRGDRRAERVTVRSVGPLGLAGRHTGVQGAVHGRHRCAQRVDVRQREAAHDEIDGRGLDRQGLERTSTE